jgi:hypothetical protein
MTQQLSANNATQMLVQRVIQDKAEAANGTLDTGNRRNGALALYYYFYVVLTQSPNKEAALDALKGTTSRIAMEGDTK